MSLGFGGSHESSSSDLSSLINTLFSQQSQFGQTGTTTGTTSGTQTAAGTQAGTQTKVLSPEQQRAQSQLDRIISSISSNPKEFLAPAQGQARESVNANYGGLADSLRQQFLSGGGGQSGKYGTAALKADLARRGQLSDVDSSFSSQAALLPLTAAGLAQNLLGINMGTNTTGTASSTGTTTGTSTGTTSSTGTSSTTGQSSEDKKVQQTGDSTKFGGGVSV